MPATAATNFPAASVFSSVEGTDETKRLVVDAVANEEKRVDEE